MKILLDRMNDRLLIHQSDHVTKVKILKIVSTNDLDFAPYPSLTLCVVDESNLTLWSQSLVRYINPSDTREAILDQEFAIYKQLSIGLSFPEGTADFVLEMFCDLYS